MVAKQFVQFGSMYLRWAQTVHKNIFSIHSLIDVFSVYYPIPLSFVFKKDILTYKYESGL